MKLVERDTCRAMPRDALDDLPEELRRRIRNLRFLESTRSGRYRNGRFPPYISGCPDNIAVGAVAAMAGAAASQTDALSSTEPQHRSTIAEVDITRDGNDGNYNRAIRR